MIELDIQETLSPISPEVGSWFPIPKPGQVNSEARIRLEKMVASQERNASVLPEGVIENMGTGLMELLGIWDIQ